MFLDVGFIIPVGDCLTYQKKYQQKRKGDKAFWCVYTCICFLLHPLDALSSCLMIPPSEDDAARSPVATLLIYLIIIDLTPHCVFIIEISILWLIVRMAWWYMKKSDWMNGNRNIQQLKWVFKYACILYIYFCF